MKAFLLILCSHGMRPFFMFGRVFEVANIVALVLVTIFLYRSSPPRGSLRQYPWGTKMRLALPFRRGWRNEVAPEHIEMMSRFRRGIFAWELIFLASGMLGVIYFDVLGPRLFLLLATGQCRA